MIFCVIQEVRIKKPNKYGAYKGLEVYQESWGDPPKWNYRYTGGRFERPHHEAYKITLHESFREGGRVRKRQFPVCTMSYYDMVEYSLYDCADGRISALAERLGVDTGALYDLIEAKLGPLRERLELDWRQSEEYQTAEAHRKLIADHLERRSKFAREYDVDVTEYDRCYDVFGVLRNEDRLKAIQKRYKANQSYERARQSYEKTYRDYFGGGYSEFSRSTYTEAERAILKRFYRALSKTYHPDLNPGKDTTEEMQLLNKLKELWQV